MANGITTGNGNGGVKTWELVRKESVVWLVRLVGGGLLAGLVYYTSSMVDSGVKTQQLQAIETALQELKASSAETARQIQSLRESVIRLGGDPR
jgi:formate/nitrite transporter FocA (FNT family)